MIVSERPQRQKIESDFERTPSQDEFVSNNKTKKSNSKRKSGVKPIVIACVVSSLGGMVGGMKIGNPIPTKPKTFDYIQTIIDNTTDEDTLDALKAKQETQQKIANSYRDGDFVYYIINDDTDTNYSTIISAEEFKRLFDIEDGAIKKYNSIQDYYTNTATSDPDGHSGIYSYDLYNFHSGDMIKVPVSAIETEDINLDGYFAYDDIDSTEDYTLVDDEYEIEDAE